jgi:hypothetical protein
MRYKTKGALLPLAAVALIGTGCGSDNAKIQRNNTYVNQVNSAQQVFQRTASSISSLITPTSAPVSDAASLQTLGTTLDGTVTAFKAAQPPSAIASLHQQLVDEVQRYATAVHAAAAKVGTETPARESVTLRNLVADIRTIDSQFNSTVDSINKKLKAT